MRQRARVAIVDDEPRMAQVLEMILAREEGLEVEAFTDPRAFLQALDEADGEDWDLVLTDLKMPRVSGLEVLRRVKASWPDAQVVVITAHGTVATALEAMRQGAFDYVEKPFDNDACRALVRRALEHSRLARENRYLRAELKSRYRLDEVIAVSEAMHEVFELARRAAASRATVLISGESGTGKELVARAIHYHSGRVGGGFTSVNCKAFAPGLLESELFGHVRGAFTGATAARAGIFERCDGGTLCLDEVGEVSGDFQAKLLRVIQEREVVRVGDQQSRPVDVRLVCATHRDLWQEVQQGRFREDLYYRIAVIPIVIPPLRQRPQDILPLARHFLQRAAQELGRAMVGWTPEVERYLLGHDWPGNVRELENAIERAVVLSVDDRIGLGELLITGSPQARARDEEAGGGGDDEELGLHDYLDRCARRRIEAALRGSGGHRGQAADLLGIDRSTLYRLMQKLGID